MQILRWDQYAPDETVAGSKKCLWSNNPRELFRSILFIVESFGGGESTGLVNFLESIREWGALISIGGYDERADRGTEEDIQRSFNKLQSIVADVTAGKFLKNIWKVEVSKNI